MDVLKAAYLLSRLSCTMDLAPPIQDFSLSFQGQRILYEFESFQNKEFDKNWNALCCFLMAVAYFSALLQHLVLNSGLVCNYSPGRTYSIIIIAEKDILQKRLGVKLNLKCHEF